MFPWCAGYVVGMRDAAANPSGQAGLLCIPPSATSWHLLLQASGKSVGGDCMMRQRLESDDTAFEVSPLQDHVWASCNESQTEDLTAGNCSIGANGI